MRTPNFKTIVRTFYFFSNYTTSRFPQYKALGPATRTTIKSMPTIPFLSSLFSTSSKPNMSYPLQKSDDEWRAVLSKGTSLPVLTTLQNPECSNLLRAISCPPSTRHRSSWLRRVRQAYAIYRSLHLCRLQCSSLYSEPKV
jgi:hypothetical protein